MTCNVMKLSWSAWNIILIPFMILSWTNWYLPEQQEYDDWFQQGSCLVKNSTVFLYYERQGWNPKYQNDLYTSTFSIEWILLVKEQNNTGRLKTDISKYSFNQAVNKVNEFLPGETYDCYWDEREPVHISWTPDIFDVDGAFVCSLLMTSFSLWSICVLFQVFSRKFNVKGNEAIEDLP